MNRIFTVLLLVGSLALFGCPGKTDVVDEKAKADSITKASKSPEDSKIDMAAPEAQKEVITFFRDMTLVIKNHTTKMQNDKTAKTAAECLIASSTDMKSFDSRVQAIQAKYKNVDKMHTANVEVKTANKDLGNALEVYLALVTQVSIKHQNDPIFKKALEQLQNENK